MEKIQLFQKQYIKQNVPQLRSGDTIRVHENTKEGDKERVQVFEGVVIATKHGHKSPNATFTVRKVSVHNVGVEKIFPLHSPSIKKIEIVKHDKVRRAKLYYIRDMKGRKKKKKASKMLGLVFEEEVAEKKPDEAGAETQEEKTE